ncbi:zinc finger, CCHC-type containing protein, partial [Tanacetum coccineum]
LSRGYEQIDFALMVKEGFDIQACTAGILMLLYIQGYYLVLLIVVVVSAAMLILDTDGQEHYTARCESRYYCLVDWMISTASMLDLVSTVRWLLVLPVEVLEPRQKEGINYFDTYAPVAHITTIRLLLALAAIHIGDPSMMFKTAFLNGEWMKMCISRKTEKDFFMSGNEHKARQNQVDKTKKFLSSKFSMKDMGEADVILGIKIKRENKGIVITQSHYIEKILKKFNREDCSLVSTPMDPIEAKYRFIFYEWMGVPAWGRCHFMGFQEANMHGSTMESEFIALAAAGKEAEWLRNLIHEIPIWPKPIAPISIRCDCAPTMARAYSQIYNGKSRHLGVRHSMILEHVYLSSRGARTKRTTYVNMKFYRFKKLGLGFLYVH